MNIRVLVVVALLCNVGSGVAQSVSPTLTFEVATIKPQTGELFQSRRSLSPDRFTEPDTTLRELVEYAYELTPLQVLGGPDWMATRRFAIDAKATGTPTRVEMRLLVRALLASRFNLQVHTEKREMAVYLLERVRAADRWDPCYARRHPVNAPPRLAGRTRLASQILRRPAESSVRPLLA